MNKNRIILQLIPQLTNSFQKRQPLNIADGAADFDKDKILILKVIRRKFLDRIGDMGNDLNRSAEIVPATFLADHRLVYPPRRHIVALAGGYTSESLIMTEIEIRFRPVVGDIAFAMFVGIHGAGIDVDIRVQFPKPYFEAARLQEGSQRRPGKAFAKRGNHTTGNENEPSHGVTL